MFSTLIFLKCVPFQCACITMSQFPQLFMLDRLCDTHYEVLKCGQGERPLEAALGTHTGLPGVCLSRSSVASGPSAPFSL